jgi:hypothetical protein
VPSQHRSAVKVSPGSSAGAWLLALSLFGLLVPNGLFVYWLVYELDGLSTVLANHLALSFMLDALLAVGLLAYLFAVRPLGTVRWPWFVLLSFLGGLGFSVPFYIWLNRSGIGPVASVS